MNAVLVLDAQSATQKSKADEIAPVAKTLDDAVEAFKILYVATERRSKRSKTSKQLPPQDSSRRGCLKLAEALHPHLPSIAFQGIDGSVQNFSRNTSGNKQTSSIVELRPDRCD
jgi:hypothetical protein